MAAVALADPIPITGIIYQGVPNDGNAGDVANQGSGLAQASFVVGAGGINFQSPPSGFTAAAFLNNPTFTNPLNGFNPNGTVDDTEIVLTGQMYIAAGSNSFVVGHDDGVVLTIAGFGTVVNAPGPTSFSNSSFTVNNAGSAGLFNFTLEYSECCSPPADLLFQVNNSTVGAVPEPSTSVLMGTGMLLALFGLGWKKRFNFNV